MKKYIIPKAFPIFLAEEAELMQTGSDNNIQIDRSIDVDGSDKTRRQSFDSPWGNTTPWNE